MVIPGLIGLGYAPEDAQNYVVAACWEFIIPGKGADIPNIGALPFASIVNRVLRETLPSASGMEEILAAVRAEIFAEARRMASAIRDIYMIPAPYLSLFFENCVERSRDISLAACTTISASTARGWQRRWIHWPQWSRRCLPKGSRRRNFCAPWTPILPVRTRCATIWRTNARNSATMTAAPTGSPASCSPILPTRCAGSQTSGAAASGPARLGHVLHLARGGAGRHRGRPPRGNAPARQLRAFLGVKLRGPVSLICSFTKPDLARVINGGPLTIEFSDTAMKDEDSLLKVAALVREFILRGGHQLQLNTLNRALLLDAQAHPENHKNLIVRVWGWSGYFVELDKCYQDHILRRAELTL